MSLKQLKKIRTQRVKRVYIELQRSKSACEQAEYELQKALRELEDYKKWRVEHQHALFEHLQSDYFSPQKLGSYNLTVEKLKLKEVRLIEDIPSFENKLQEAQQAFDAIRKQLQSVRKDSEKVDEFILMQDDEEKLLDEKKEENVADELSCFKSSQG